MTKYNVHIYREMKLFYADVKADSIEEAAKKASELNSSEAEEIEDAEGVNLSALVDVQGDDDYENSRIIDFEVQRRLNAFDNLLEALRAVLPYAEAELASLHEAQKRDGDLEAEVTECEAKIDLARAAIAEVISKEAA